MFVGTDYGVRIRFLEFEGPHSELLGISALKPFKKSPMNTASDETKFVYF